MAATRLIAMHQNNGKSIKQSLKDRIDYAENKEKTEDGELISSYACDKETVDHEFYLAKQEYFRKTGRKPKGDILAYQIRQSFKPGEITPEEANKVGYETAMRFTKGEHAFIVATHTDRAHIHNHIIMNSVNLSCDRKFRDAWFIALVLQKVSDRVCLEHALSVITPRKPSERDDHNPYHRVSFRSVARAKIDELISENPKNFDEFLRQLSEAGYEIKPGKHISFRGTGQKRFLRLRSLGKGYSEEEIRKRILGEYEFDTSEEQTKHDKKPKRDFDLLIDINKKMREGKGKGYERWAKTYNVKQVSKALLYLQEHGIRDYADLTEKTKNSAGRFHEIADSIKEKESRLTEITDLKTAIKNYSKTKDTYAEYRKAGYSKKFFEAHREDIQIHKSAKSVFDKYQIRKFPKWKELSEEYGRILTEKRKLYEEYRLAKKEMMDYQIAKQDIDKFLKIDEEQRQNEKRQEHER